MTDSLLRLYPLPAERRPLRGLYLEAPLETGVPRDRAFVYSNFVVSLDGRISIPAGSEGGQSVPASTANSRDWRLFQELAGRCELLITSGRYFRELAAGSAQAELPVSGEAPFADIRQARERLGLPPQPDVAVVSAGLDFPLPEALLRQGRRIMVFTAAGADGARRAELERRGVSVFPGTGPRVGAAAVVGELERRGYRRVYCVTGPQVLHTLLDAGRLDTLFLTIVPKLLGGEPFGSLVQGPLLATPAGYRLRWLYLDENAPEPTGQLMARFDRVS